MHAENRNMNDQSFWVQAKLKYLLQINPEALNEKTAADVVIRYIDISSVNSDGKIESMQDFAFKDAPSRARRKVKPGDVIVSTVRTYLAAIAFIEEDSTNLIASTGFAVLRVKDGNMSPRFMFYALRSTYFLDQVSRDSVGVSYPSITSEDLGNLPVYIPADFIPSSFIPSFSHQTAIASYLDRKTAEIDALIADKKRLLDLYEEEKTALINHAVTRGLHPDAPLKPSGIEWIGDIPAHWEVKRLKMLVSKIGSGITPSGGSAVYQTNGVPLLRSQNIHFDGLRLDDVAYISEEIDESMSNSRVQEKDILLNITGASIGRCFYVPDGFGAGNVNQHVCIIRPILDEIQPLFLHLILRSIIGQSQIRLQQTGANREGLNFEQLKNFVLPIPESLSEQNLIVRHIETETARVDAKKAHTEKLIALLTEYRTALISEVVTGKVKVAD